MQGEFSEGPGLHPDGRGGDAVRRTPSGLPLRKSQSAVELVSVHFGWPGDAQLLPCVVLVVLCAAVTADGPWSCSSIHQ